MNYRNLGRSGLKVSEISLGSWLTFGQTIDERTAESIIHRAFESGINFFDCANVYAKGKAEQVMGRALKSFARESYVVTTKAFWPVGDGPNDKGLSRKHIMEQVHSSLKRMELDYIDVFYCHRYDKETPLDETLRAIDDCIRQGKILYAGVSEWSAAQLQEAVHIADRYLLDRIVVNQPQYNMLHRDIEEEIMPISERNGISQVVWSPLAQGVLTGKYMEGKIPSGSRASNEEVNTWVKEILNDIMARKVSMLSELAASLDLSLAQLALAWTLRIPNVASTLVGASTPEQIEENAKASSVMLSYEVLNEIESILAI
ncbi:aldo/keto reductase [Bacillus mangrovi]|uniref:Aldo/keto reductase n=1 Tax=Metabacillus mangrovi TaxID=1491830 RepID=A0A7X2V4J9_9BACI|nr:aldo/keto reductase family protein [Metabacillus mangrovi]MTH53189.1 aldo/keto reductase [Metabacillus mangrovi]